MYDIFYLGEKDKQWNIIKSRYSNAQIFDTHTSIEYLQKKSFTSSFWVIPNDLTLTDFDLNSYKGTKWDQEYTHVFKNGNFYDGICLINKKSKISKREFDNRFFANKKEIDIVASYPTKFDVFTISSYEDYLNAVNKSSTQMFWAVWNDLIPTDFNFNFQVPKYNQSIVHIFKNNNYFDGICLFPKHITYAKREIEKRFFQVKKEIDIVASNPKHFDIVFISYYEPFADQHYEKLISKIDRPIHRINGIKGIHNAHIEAAKLVNTNMFWVVDADAEVLDNFKFDHQVSKVDQDIVFVWRSKNPVNGLEYGNGGIKLLPTKLTLEMKTDTPDMTTSISGRFRAMPEISNISKFNTDPFNSWKSAFRECSKLASRIIPGQIDEETQHRLDVWCTETVDECALNGAKQGKEYGLLNRNDTDALKKINDFVWLEEQFNERYRKN
jgi:hypothetical protein